jgi:geranylgeranyl pyrophosphate synthase
MDSGNLSNSEEFSKLEQEIFEIGERTRNRFKEIALRNVDHPEMISSLENLCNYWKDNIRPALIQYSCEAVGGKPDIVDSVALFFSIAGSGVGIHDDIIDRTIKKRDRVTIPGVYGQDFALTIGDLLIVKGLTTISEALKENHSKETIVQVLEAFESFFTEMCVGEAMEIRARKNLDMTLDDYHTMLWKLGVDTEACTRIGAILGEGTKTEIESLALFGRLFGYLNRLDDEIRDVLSLENDVRFRIYNESIPLLLLYAAKQSRNSYLTIKRIIEKADITPEEKGVLLYHYIHHNGFDYIQNVSKEIKNDALSTINELDDSDAKKKLIILINKLDENIKKIGYGGYQRTFDDPDSDPIALG